MAIISYDCGRRKPAYFSRFHEFCLSDRPASDCTDQPLLGPGFRISSDFQRQSLARRSVARTVPRFDEIREIYLSNNIKALDSTQQHPKRSPDDEIFGGNHKANVRHITSSSRTGVKRS